MKGKANLNIREILSDERFDVVLKEKPYSDGLSNIDIKGKIELLNQALIAYDEYSSRKNKALDELNQLTFYKLGYDGEYRVHKK